MKNPPSDGNFPVHFVYPMKQIFLFFQSGPYVQMIS